jgi:hypothetical protein
MEFRLRSRAAVGALAAAVVCSALALGSTAASASGDSAPPGSPQVTHGGGAVDLQGRPVESRTYVGDTPPSDLGTLQWSGSATAGPEPITGTFPE